MPNETSSQPTFLAGLNVRAEMARRGVTQSRVGAWLGMAPSAVSHRLTGRTPLDINELVKIADLLNVPLGRLLDGVGSDNSTAVTA